MLDPIIRKNGYIPVQRDVYDVTSMLSIAMSPLKLVPVFPVIRI